MLPKCAYYRYILPHLIVFVNPYLQARIRLYTSIRLDTPLFSLYYLYMPTPNNLQNLGLSADQTAIYLTLLNSGPQSAISLAKLSGIKRTYIYHLCKELEKEGHIKLTQKGRTTYFSAQSPDLLLAKAQEKKAQAETALLTLQSILPELQSKYRLTDTKPVVTFYEGEMGIIKANLEVLNEKKEILAYLIINKSIDKKMDDFWKKYYEQRIRDNIHVRAITSNTNEGIEYKKRDKEELRETKLVPNDQFTLAIEKNIVGDKVVFFSTSRGVLNATIIDNKEIADTERAIFELAWQKASQYDRELNN